MKQVKFNKDISHCCCYLNISKFYDVEKETDLNVFIKDEFGNIHPYPRTWINEQRVVEVYSDGEKVK